MIPGGIDAAALHRLVRESAAEQGEQLSPEDEDHVVDFIGELVARLEVEGCEVLAPGPYDEAENELYLTLFGRL